MHLGTEDTEAIIFLILISIIAGAIYGAVALG